MFSAHLLKVWHSIEHKSNHLQYNRCKNGHLKIDKTTIIMTNGSLMKVKSIAKCILQYLDLHLAINGIDNQFLSF